MYSTATEYRNLIYTNTQTHVNTLCNRPIKAYNRTSLTHAYTGFDLCTLLYIFRIYTVHNTKIVNTTVRRVSVYSQIQQCVHTPLENRSSIYIFSLFLSLYCFHCCCGRRYHSCNFSFALLNSVSLPAIIDAPLSAITTVVIYNILYLYEHVFTTILRLAHQYEQKNVCNSEFVLRYGENTR